MGCCSRCGADVESLHKNVYEPMCDDCYKELLESYGNISVYRFICIEELEKTLQSQTLRFRLPSAWPDTYEEYFYKIIHSARINEQMDPIHIRECLSHKDSCYFQCWTLTQESQFFWDKYGVVRIEAKLKDLFELGLRPVAVRYDKIPLPKDLKYKRCWRMLLSRRFSVNEDNEFIGLRKTKKMLYNDHLYGSIIGYVREFETYFRPLPLEMVSTLKDIQFSIENEVRMIFKPNHNPLYEEYEKQHNEYRDRILSVYADYKDPLDTGMKDELFWSYKEKPDLIRSVLCHPEMSDEHYEYVKSILDKASFTQRFLGRSKLFYHNEVDGID